LFQLGCSYVTVSHLQTFAIFIAACPTEVQRTFVSPSCFESLIALLNHPDTSLVGIALHSLTLILDAEGRELAEYTVHPHFIALHQCNGLTRLSARFTSASDNPKQRLLLAQSLILATMNLSVVELTEPLLCFLVKQLGETADPKQQLAILSVLRVALFVHGSILILFLLRFASSFPPFSLEHHAIVFRENLPNILTALFDSSDANIVFAALSCFGQILDYGFVDAHDAVKRTLSLEKLFPLALKKHPDFSEVTLFAVALQRDIRDLAKFSVKRDKCQPHVPKDQQSAIHLATLLSQTLFLRFSLFLTLPFHFSFSLS
jgi:hypothetical protein